MKTLSLFLLLALSGITACTTPSQSNAHATQEQLAEELMAIVPPEIMFAQLAEPYAQAYALPHKQTKAHSNFMRNVDLNEVNRIIREALLKHFTEAELKALVSFYSTPEGRSCMTKAAPFAADVVPSCSHEATKAFRKTALDAARGALLP